MVKLICFILRTTTVAGLGVQIFRVFTVKLVGKIAKSVRPGQAASILVNHVFSAIFVIISRLIKPYG